ncbi:MAG TPA: flotillin family protein, partial [Planctomycetota bacterium]|nr:flotillin family protein [Planctomycetota bacterium]
EKIVIVSTGGETAGASKLTADVAKVIAQLPPTVEALSGVRLTDLIEKVRGSGKAPAASDGGRRASP